MYPISQNALDLYLNGYRQVVDITLFTADSVLHLNESDIMQGGLAIDRYCTSTNKLEIGSAIAAEMTLKLDNRRGRFDDVTFEGAEMFVRLGIKKWDAMRWENAQVDYMPMGYFTVDETPRKLNTITLRALDRMVQFDKLFDKEAIVFPKTIKEIVDFCCQKCYVSLHTDMDSLPNTSYVVNTIPDVEGLTYRQILMWCGQITGTCLYIDWNGRLRLEWYGAAPVLDLTPALRYESDLSENPITISGIFMTDAEKTEYIVGTKDYAFEIVDNKLLENDVQSVLDALAPVVLGTTYLPFSAKTQSLPHMYPLDRITFIDGKGNAHSTIITHWNFKMNARTSISAKGETATRKGYATVDPMTAMEKKILAQVAAENEKKLNTRQETVLALNETLVNSLGLYKTDVEMENGSIVFYFHNQPVLEDSTVIYTFREGGFAWTDAWQGDDTVWQYGFTRDGNAVLSILSAYKLTADLIGAGAITADKIASGAVSADKVQAQSITADKLSADVLTAERINALGITAKTLNIRDANGNPILVSNSIFTNIGGWLVTDFGMKKQADDTSYTGLVTTDQDGYYSAETAPQAAIPSIVTPYNVADGTFYSTVRFYAGAPLDGDHINYKSASFAVLSDGSLLSKAAKIDKGIIGGWKIDETGISYQSADTRSGILTGSHDGTEQSEKNRLSLVTPLINGNPFYSTVRFYAGAPGDDYNTLASQAPFAILNDGSAYMQAAKIEQSADIGSFRIDSSGIHSTLGTYGTFTYKKADGQTETVTGFKFAAMLGDGFYYIITETSDFQSTRLARIPILNLVSETLL